MCPASRGCTTSFSTLLRVSEAYITDAAVSLWNLPPAAAFVLPHHRRFPEHAVGEAPHRLNPHIHVRELGADRLKVGIGCPNCVRPSHGWLDAERRGALGDAEAHRGDHQARSMEASSACRRARSPEGWPQAPGSPGTRAHPSCCREIHLRQRLRGMEAGESSLDDEREDRRGPSGHIDLGVDDEHVGDPAVVMNSLVPFNGSSSPLRRAVVRIKPIASASTGSVSAQRADAGAVAQAPADSDGAALGSLR